MSIVKGNEEYCNAAGFLRESLRIGDHLFDMRESMICQTYRFLNKPNVNDVWYEKCCGETFPEPSKIPPIKDKLHQHFKRVNYHAFAWKNALQAKKHGWSTWLGRNRWNFVNVSWNKFLVQIFANGKANVNKVRELFFISDI